MRNAPLPAADGGGAAPAAQPSIHVEAISDALRREFRINPFYTRTLTIDGIPVVGSDKVSDYSATNEQEYWAEGAQAWFDCAAQR